MSSKARYDCSGSQKSYSACGSFGITTLLFAVARSVRLDTVSDFGDFEPEDAWDAGDDFADLARNLRHRIVILDEALALAAAWRADGEQAQVDELESRLAVHIRRRDEHTPRNLVRIVQTRDDIAYLRQRAI